MILDKTFLNSYDSGSLGNAIRNQYYYVVLWIGYLSEMYLFNKLIWHTLLLFQKELKPNYWWLVFSTPNITIKCMKE